jgi:hypothetical protein
MSKELPSIEELRASQAKGASGKGTAEQTYGEMQADFNMGTGVAVSDNTMSDEDSEGYGFGI